MLGVFHKWSLLWAKQSELDGLKFRDVVLGDS